MGFNGLGDVYKRQSVDTLNLVHNVQRSLRIKNALYVDARQCGNFTIDWCICAAGCVKSVSGTLSVIVESNDY